MQDGEPWFVLADVCKVLGLSNPSAVKNGLNSKDVNTLSSIEGIKGRGANATTVNESGLYDVILDSRKPEASDTPLAIAVTVPVLQTWH